FEGCAEAYESYRPGYPDELFEYLKNRFGLGGRSTVVDIGAGTGRATWPLAEPGCKVYAVEPSAAMRDKGQAHAAQFGGRVKFIDGTAEATSLDGETADLIISAQAFHWFDPLKALPEAARILKPSAGIALFWNNRDQDRNPIATELDQLIQWANPKHEIAYRGRAWDEVLEASGLFEQIDRRIFYHTSTMTADSMCGLFRSVSYVWNVLDQEGQANFEQQLRSLVDRHYGSNPFPLVYRLEAYAAQRR